MRTAEVLWGNGWTAHMSDLDRIIALEAKVSELEKRAERSDARQEANTAKLDRFLDNEAKEWGKALASLGQQNAAILAKLDARDEVFESVKATVERLDTELREAHQELSSMKDKIENGKIPQWIYWFGGLGILGGGGGAATTAANYLGGGGVP